MSWTSIAGGIGSALIGSAGSLWSSYQNLGESKRNREWQERMSNTAHQREVADLRAAGLNPILSGLGGSGAAVGGGSMARTENPFENAGNDFHSARRFNEIEKEQLKNETDLKNSTTELNRSNTALAVEQQKLTALNQRVSTAQEANIIADLPVKRALAASHTASAARDMAQAGVASAQVANINADTELKQLDAYSGDRLVRGVFRAGDKELSKELIKASNSAHHFRSTLPQHVQDRYNAFINR